MPDVQVAVRHLEVPVAEPEPPLPPPAPAPLYAGRFISVRLAEPAYAPGERIRVICEVEVTRAGKEDITWYSEIRAYDIRDPRAPQRLTQVRATHVSLRWEPDTETWDTDLDLGPQPEEGLRAELQLWAGGSEMVPVARMPLGVRLPWEPMPAPPPGEPVRPAPWVIAGIAIVAILILLYYSTRK